MSVRSVSVRVRLAFVTVLIAVIAASFWGETLGDFVLASGTASLSGTVTNTSATPLAGIRVDAQSDQFGLTAFTDSSGHYTLSGLPPYTYRVSFQDPNFVYSPQWYANQNDYLAGFEV